MTRRTVGIQDPESLGRVGIESEFKGSSPAEGGEPGPGVTYTFATDWELPRNHVYPVGFQRP